MSNAVSIAAITATLRDLLDRSLNADVSGTTVTARPPDLARNGINGSQVNLFLYHTMIDPSWRNMDIPWRVKPGEQGHPPLPLNLYYIITAYAGENDDDVDTITDPRRLLGSHRLLGQAMSTLHDHPVLTTEEVHNILPPDDRSDFPYDQAENVRITPEPLTLEELSKIWTGFQTQYRLTAAYEVSVVLIESRRPRRLPMPVLRRGPDDRGVDTVVGPFPTLETIRRPAGERYGVQLGDTIELIGRNLGGDVVRARFYHPLMEDVQTLTPTPDSDEGRLVVDLPPADEGTAASDWAAGFYAVDVLLSSAGGPDQATNQLPMALSPIVQTITPNPAPRDGNGDVTLTIICAPQVLPEQRARLLLGEREIQSAAHPTPTDTLTFEITDAPAGTFVLRLRLDGVDSLPLKPNEQGDPDFDPGVREGALIFDPQQTVVIT